MDNLTYTVYHIESGKVIASNLSEINTISLIQRMINTNLVTGISLKDYMNNPYKAIDMIRLLADIESQGVFNFRHTWHVG